MADITSRITLSFSVCLLLYLVAHHVGIEVCSPTGDYHQNTYSYGGGNLVSEFQCTELVMRYLWLKSGFQSLGNTDGDQIVNNYSWAHPDKLHAINNDSRMAIMKIAPVPGDVISFNYVHTAIVYQSTVNIYGTGDLTIIEQNSPLGSASFNRTIHVSNWIIDPKANVKNWMTPRSSPGYPGGWWLGPTPSDFATVGSNVTLSFQTAKNGSDGIDHVNFTKYTPSSGKWSTFATVKPNGNGVVSTTLTLSEQTVVSADVYGPIHPELGNTQNFQLAPNRIRHLCFGGNCDQIKNVAYGDTGGPSIGGGGGPNGFQVCQNTSFGSPCETFQYSNNSTCISLDQMRGHNRSVQFLGNYSSNYDAIMYHDTNCQTYLARYGSASADIGAGLYDQFSSMRLEVHVATQVSPGNGAVLPAGTTQTVVTFAGSAPFTLHVWGSGIDVWQPNINTTTYHITGLQAGITYSWQISGNVGGWSSTWTFTVANPPTSATQLNPANGTVFAPNTTFIGVNFRGVAPFTLHVWDLTTHYDVWQENITTPYYNLSGLQNGATYNWQVLGNSGSWSPTWIFSIANPQTPAQQVSPASGTQFRATTSSLTLTYSGTGPFTIHVWGPSYDVWQPNWPNNTYQLLNLRPGITYQWQVAGVVGDWSPAWTFQVG